MIRKRKQDVEQTRKGLNRCRLSPFLVGTGNKFEFNAFLQEAQQHVVYEMVEYNTELPLIQLLDKFKLIDYSVAICSDILFKGLEGCNLLSDTV